MTKIPKDIRDLLWAEEELGEAERVRLEAYLAEHPEAAEQRRRIRALESRARDSPAIPPLHDPVYGLSGEEERQERASYHALIRRLRGKRAAGRAGWRTGGWLRWVMPVAAAAAIALVWLGDFRGEGGVRDLVVLRVDREGVTRSVGAGDVWRSGDSFALEARFPRGAVPFVFLVDPAGVPSMLHPMTGSEAVPTERDGTLRFPSPESGQIWLLGPETGPETFLMVAGHPDPPPAPELAARIEALAGGDRTATLDAVIGLLETEVGPVATVEIDHRP